ncbi:hypothetical protein PN498_12590 [Oscillatoria sp. CS-180]|uniref:hypothetical protein n=1 Tax=Oscillatoria sp. CS-180 TaxID=3021720 RepID=UPI00232AF4C9|nr:hypothetical protein [Oscillatoria sp. CS-180]MDB9526829.1 hypothetical protein [Oscillatoria sp. CS-180]
MVYQSFLDSDTEVSVEALVPSLSEVWAKKYVGKVAARNETLTKRDERSCKDDVVQCLTSKLRSVSAQAWNKTESLLKDEMERHDIDQDLIDPWKISKDIHQIFEKTITAYSNYVTPGRFSVLVSKNIGDIRRQYTAVDPRVIGFVSMQFHYCGQLLLKNAPESETTTLQQYFKVIDDHLYMPLQRAYEAAGNYTYDNPRLRTVQALLPNCTTIAHSIVQRVNQLYPNYTCYSGRLDSEPVRISSVRDVEMFQIYLWTSVLERNISAIAQELFPLCVMLYPTFNVNWELVRQMISLMEKAFIQCVEPEQIKYYQPYHRALWKMFSPEVFPESL